MNPAAIRFAVLPFPILITDILEKLKRRENLESPIIVAKNLTKIYETKAGPLFRKKTKKVRALNDLSFEIKEGELIGLLGPNGAGKTTLIKILTLLLLPSSGHFTLNNFPGILKYENQIKASVGVMLMGERGLYWKLSGRENLEYFCALYHFPRTKTKDRVNYLINLIPGLNSIADRPVESYSSGQKMKFAFVRSLVSDPPILILDEPTVTMDVGGARELRALIKKLHEENRKTILYSTHIMTECEELADRALIVDRGELVDFDSVENLKSSLDKDETILVEGQFPDRSVISAIEEIKGVKSVGYANSNSIGGNDSVTAIVEDSRRLMGSILDVLQQYKTKIKFISPREVTLEDVFVSRTGRTLAEDSSGVVLPNGIDN
ncbi:MAG TPA: ABC transporter ATP-binding protein [Candidatus Hodarchaeales archaeon]|nr:ABC transporter ATP-binding protein [Candidatus Hodarchaeales archaeon]